MTVKARASEELAALYAEHLDGRTIAQFLVHGINSVKSMEAPLDVLVGQRIRSLTATGDATFELGIGDHVLAVDLQRTGVVQWLASADPWTFGKPSMPTGQLLLDGGSGANFTEPAKTKRITFRISRV